MVMIFTGLSTAVLRDRQILSEDGMVSVLISHKGIHWDQENIVNIVLMISVRREDRKRFIEL